MEPKPQRYWNGELDRVARRRWSYADLLADAERVARALLPRLTGAVSRRVLARGCRGGGGTHLVRSEKIFCFCMRNTRLAGPGGTA